MSTQLSYIHSQVRQAELARTAEQIRIDHAGGPVEVPVRRGGLLARLRARRRAVVSPAPSYADSPCP